MLSDVLILKQRIFGFELEDEIFSNQEQNQEQLEEILESLTNKEEIFVFPLDEKKDTIDLEKVEEEFVLVEENEGHKPKFLLYEIFENNYLVYIREKDGVKPKYINDHVSEGKSEYGLFVPSGVTVSRVPTSTLGTGVLGRAFIYANRIEILDSLFGNEYIEVLTHEILHIQHPEKKEMEIRQMTRNYVGVQNTTYH